MKTHFMNLKCLTGNGRAFALMTLLAISTMAVSADGVIRPWDFNRPGNVLIADQCNNRVIQVNRAGRIVADYGLPLAGGDTIGNNAGYGLHTSQQGLYAPYDAKVVGDYTGLTPP